MDDSSTNTRFSMRKLAPSEWEKILPRLPNPHILQTRQWAEVKQEVGWVSSYYGWANSEGLAVAGALLLTRKAGFGPVKIKIMYAPRGPLLDWSDTELYVQVLSDLKRISKKEDCAFLKIDPEIIVGEGVPGDENALENSIGLAARDALLSSDWVLSPEQIQFQNTAWLNLDGTEEDWLGRMKQKTRYNLRLAMKKGVIIRRATPEDFPALYRMYAETSVRDGFVIRSASYYEFVWRKYYELGMAYPIMAEVDGVPITGLVMLVLNKTAWYLYGMSTENDREKMPNYYLQWEAMRLAKSLGCLRYDLWGAPDVFSETDRMWGVFRFKLGLGAVTIRTPGAFDFIIQPMVYSFYIKILPRLLAILRRRGKAKTLQEVVG